jgi:hypothetical protein
MEIPKVRSRCASARGGRAQRAMPVRGKDAAPAESGRRSPAERARMERAGAERARAERSAAERAPGAAGPPGEARRAESPGQCRTGRDRGRERAEHERVEKAMGKDVLRPREKEHVDWVTNLVNLPHDPELNTRRS